MVDPAPSISITELGRRTGLSAAVIRRWEERYGYPVALRVGAGHRRYDVSTVRIIESALRKRESGTRLSIAISEALAEASAAQGSPAAYNPSLFAQVRNDHPEVLSRRLSMPAVAALSHAIEDEAFAGLGDPILFGFFQIEANYLAAAARWNDLAEISRATFVFAAFPGPPVVEAAARVNLSEAGYLRREWAVVCDSTPSASGGDDAGPAMPVAMVAREGPGQGDTDPSKRSFDTVWTLDPVVVREVSRVCARLAHESGAPGAGEVVRELAGATKRPPAATPSATALFARLVGYLDPAVSLN